MLSLIAQLVIREKKCHPYIIDLLQLLEVYRFDRKMNLRTEKKPGVSLLPDMGLLPDRYGTF